MCMLSRGKFTLENMLENNCHGRYASFFKNHELKEADKYIKRVFPNAEFYIDYEHALVFERIGEDEKIDLDYHTVIIGNVIKYVSRAPYKGAELEDLKKAKWYLEREIKKHDN